VACFVGRLGEDHLTIDRELAPEHGRRGIAAALLRRVLDSLSIANPVLHASTGQDALGYLNRVAETAAIAAVARAIAARG